MTSNWKTTLFGALAALGLYFSTSSNATLATVGKALQALATLAAGYFAADATATTTTAKS